MESESLAQFYAPLDRVVGDAVLAYIREHHEEMLVRREGTDLTQPHLWYPFAR